MEVLGGILVVVAVGMAFKGGGGDVDHGDGARGDGR